MEQHEWSLLRNQNGRPRELLTPYISVHSVEPKPGGVERYLVQDRIPGVALSVICQAYDLLGMHLNDNGGGECISGRCAAKTSF
jgi:hypothetical protein